MNSFFYGNTFGRHNMIFPLVISKIQPMVDLSSCCFSDEDKDKSKTARVILGNMIRETGSAYTYEISLFGYTKNVNCCINRTKCCLFCLNTSRRWAEVYSLR